VNWSPGDDVILVPSLTDEEARKRYPEGWKALNPYLRVVPDPSAAKKRAKTA
jgi:peroxiredoxin (alkyl hydroperoxide reductase subunit C)